MLTWRKLLVLLKHLPAESALNTVIRNNALERDLALHEAKADPAKSSWSTVETLLASLVDEMRINTWVYVQAHSDKKVPKPDPIRRPGSEKRRGKLMSIEDAQRLDPRLRGMSAEEAQATLDRMTGRG